MKTDNIATGDILKVLALEDSAQDFEIISEQLIDAGFRLNISRVETEEAFISSLRENQYDIILSDFKLPGFDAFGALRISNEICPEVPFICVSGSIGEETAIELLKLGAVDYVLKDRPERLPFAVKRALDEAKDNKLREKAQEDLLSIQKAALNLLEDLKAENLARKEKETELEKVTMAIEQAGEVVMITDPAGMIQYVNPAFETVSGYSREEAVGKTAAILKSGEQDQAFYQNLWKTITGGRIWQGRMVNKRKDSTLYTEDATISPVFDLAGKIINFVGVKRDITAHLEMTAQLQQAQKMESVGRLAGGVAHDFNNMLSIILGYTELALDKTDPAGALHANLQEVFKAAMRSVDITRQLLAFARKQTIAPVVIDLNTTVEGMLKMLRRLIGEDIDLAWMPGFGVWPVKIDPSQVDQILANLCVNARDAITGVGKVTIETGNVLFDEDYIARHSGFVSGEFVLLTVSDNGCGMDKETLDHLFEPFFTTKEVNKGTGLGLATVYGIVKQNNGFINVYSEPGKGTSFKIHIPRDATGIVETKDSKSTPLLLGRGETVLLVEDEPALLGMAKTMIEHLGYTVLSASAPSEALRLAEEHIGEIHLILTDVVMPEMNGRNLAQRISAFYPEMKYLFMSGYTANVIAHQGVLDEGVHFIQKPLSIKNLAAKVREALNAQ